MTEPLPPPFPPPSAAPPPPPDPERAAPAPRRRLSLWAVFAISAAVTIVISLGTSARDRPESGGAAYLHGYLLGALLFAGIPVLIVWLTRRGDRR